MRAWADAEARLIEVVVVDDGSTDGTAAIAQAHGCRTVVLPRNRGKGAAVRAGMLEAEGALRLMTDADLPTPLEELGALEAALGEGHAAAIGLRRSLMPATLRNRARAAVGGAFAHAVHRAGLTELTDTQCGFKLFRAEAAEAVFSRSIIDGFAFDVEVLVILRRLGLSVRGLPVSWVNSIDTRVDLLRDPIPMLIDLARIRRHDRRGGYA